MKKKWIVIGVVSIIVVLIGFNVWKASATNEMKVETVTLSEELMKETVMTPGTLQLAQEQNVYYQAEKGEIAEIFVEEGDSVEKGDQLLRYENNQLDLEKRQNDLQIRSTSLQLENIRKKHREIDKELEKDKDNEMLQQEHDEIKLQEQMSVIELEQSQLQRESITKQLEELTVTAKVDGTVLSVNENATTDPLGEKPIIQIGTLADLIVEGTISEYDTMNISVGQEVRLTSDAVPEEEWKGKVSFIGDLPKDQTIVGMEQTDSSVLYPITVTLEEDIKLKPGFKMLIEIITKEEKVNTLPIETIIQEDDNNYVFIVEDGKAKRVEVKTGIVDTNKIEIIEGVGKKDKVIINPPDNLSDGMEVTIQ